MVADILGENWHKELGTTSDAKAAARAEFYEKRADLKVEASNEDLGRVSLEPTLVTEANRYLFGVLEAAFGMNLAYKILKVAARAGFNVDRFDLGDKVSIQAKDGVNYLIKENAQGALIQEVPIAAINAATHSSVDALESDSSPVAPAQEDLATDQKEAPPFSVDENLPLDEQWLSWKKELMQKVVEQGMRIEFKKEKDARIKLVIHHGDRKESLVIQRFLARKTGGYTSKDARITWGEDEFSNPVEGLMAILESLKNPKKELEITWPWEPHQHAKDPHSDSHDSHDGHIH